MKLGTVYNIIIIVLILFLGGTVYHTVREMHKENMKSHIHTAPLRVYQIEIESQDTFSVWDGNRLVKKFFLTDDTEIGNMIIYDQE